VSAELQPAERRPLEQCMLVRKEMFAQQPERSLVLGIHGHGGDCEQLSPFCSTFGSGTSAVLPQAWRPLNIHGMAEAVHPGYSWYFSFSAHEPEPATFGDCLIELESLIYDLVSDGQRERVAIIGFEQGATLALTLAGVIPEKISAVVAIGGCIPHIKGWSLPAQDLQGLPILMVTDEAAEANLAELSRRSLRSLRALGAEVRIEDRTASSQNPLTALEPARDWLFREPRHR
jgi:predicted esterase